MDEENLDARDESGNDVFIAAVTPRADRANLSGPGGEVGAAGGTRYFLNSTSGEELFMQEDGTLKGQNSEKYYRLSDL